MGIQLSVYQEGEKVIALTNHSINNYRLMLNNETNLAPRLHGINCDMVLEGFINVDLVDEAPRPLLDDDGDVMVDENGDEKHDLREIDSVREIAQWAIILEHEEPYCDVEITLVDARGAVVKEDAFKDMFVVGYEEHYSEKQGNGTFKIHMRERFSVEED